VQRRGGQRAPGEPRHAGGAAGHVRCAR
jgi:hypothetical protein